MSHWWDNGGDLTILLVGGDVVDCERATVSDMKWLWTRAFFRPGVFVNFVLA